MKIRFAAAFVLPCALIGWAFYSRRVAVKIEDDRQALLEIHREHLRRMESTRDPDQIVNDMLWLAYWSDCYRRLITRHNWTQPWEPWANLGDKDQVELVGERAVRKIKTLPCPPAP